LVDDSLVRLDPDGTTDPSQAEIESWINEAEDYIDAETMHSWRTVTITDETHDANRRWDALLDREYAVTLRHRSVKTFSHVASDKIELWNGSVWKDIVDPLNGCTEDRNRDYWVDYVNGIVYLVQQRPMVGKAMIRVSYRYGEVAVPNDIAKAAAKLAALHVLETDYAKMAMPNGPGFEPPKASVIDRWQRDVERVIDIHREVKGVFVVG
jgi:hypothetical protein